MSLFYRNRHLSYGEGCRVRVDIPHIQPSGFQTKSLTSQPLDYCASTVPENVQVRQSMKNLKGLLRVSLSKSS